MEGTLAEIRMFAGNFAPRNWAYCQGQLLAISSNQALFSLLGTTYGGDGRTTFGLPDLRGRVAVGTGRGTGLSDVKLGAKGGFEHTTLTEAQIPAHTHAAALSNVTGSAVLNANSGNGSETSATGNYVASTPDGRNSQTTFATSADTVMASDAVELTSLSATVNVGITGGSQSIDLRQPQLGMNYIICMVGTFPSRS